MELSNQINPNNKNPNTSYDNCNTKPKKFYKSDLDKNAEEINDNISEKANSVQTSYKYRKNKKGPNSLSSKEKQDNYQFYESSIDMSENDNLICPNCINCTLMEEKKRRENLNNMRDLREKEYENEENTNAIIDKNRNYNRDIINEKRRQREKNINDAYQNLAKIKAGMSPKEKLIQINENSRNPLNEGFPDYQYQKFQDEYARRQKMINENINKYYPNINNERPEISSYYENYINNPNYAKERKNKIYDENIKGRDYDQNDNSDKKEYLKYLEEQINYKNELKKREKEEERRRGQRQYEEIQNELKREEQERYMKEQKKRDELIKANLELINQKNKLKIKELEEKLKYRELSDKQNDDYLKELERQKIEKEKLKEELYNQNRNEYEIRQKNKLLEKERNQRYDNEYDYPRRKYDKKYGDMDYDIYNRQEPKERYDKKYDEKDNKYDERQRNYDEKYDYKDYRDKNINKIGHSKVKERMGRCCRCHRIFPRKLLSINNYFYKENRV